MGLFPKKKGTKDFQSSPLSEAEIHRKLYGEFEAGSSHVVLGDRDHLKDPAVSAPSGNEAGMSHDLFSAPSDVPIETDVPKRSFRPEIKSPENSSRHVPIHEFEKKAGETPDPVNAYARFRSGATAKMKNKIVAAFAVLLENGRKFLASLLDPKSAMVRRVLYWAVAAGVVFLLFWGVNALNSQREEAMKVPYKSHKERSSATNVTPAPSHEKGVSVAKAVVAERPVVITPAPPRPREVVITPASQIIKRKAVSADASGPYAIQVVTYPSQVDADQVVETLKKNQLSAFVKEYKRPSGRVFYVVFIGGYRTEAEAQAQLVKFRAKEVARPFQDAFVKTTNG